MSVKVSAPKSVIRRRPTTSSFADYASESRAQGRFVDVRIEAGTELIAAHRMVLSCHSLYFQAMFQSGMLEQYQDTVEMGQVDGKCVKMLIDYMYTCEININIDNVLGLLDASDYLQLDDVKGFCLEFLGSILEPNNAIQIFKIVNSYRNDSIQDHIHQYISVNVEEIAQTPDFKSLTKDELITCISNLNRNRIKEISVYDVVLEWMRFDLTTRGTMFSELFQQLINVDQLSIELIEDVLLTEELILNNVGCHHLVLRAFSKHLKDKSAALKKSKVISLGGSTTPQKVHDVYNSNGEALLSYADLPETLGLLDHCSLQCNDHVYCIGGTTGDSHENYRVLNQVWRLNMKKPNAKWEEVASMLENRCAMGAAKYGDGFVVAGGMKQDKKLYASAEFYNIQTNQWNAISPLQQLRKNVVLVTCNNHVYALGGVTDGRVLSTTVERLNDLQSESWELVQPMQTQRTGQAAVNCNGFIYAIGGLSKFNDPSTSLKTVEKYDAFTNAWVFVKSMKNPRSYHSACVLNGKIFVIGGFKGNIKFVREIECYDPSIDEWSVVGKTNDCLCWHSVVSL